MKTGSEVRKQAPADDAGQVQARRDSRIVPPVEGSPQASERGGIPLDLLDDNPDQPRQYMDPDYIDELAETILQRGLIHRIVVRRMGARFQVVAGHRRRDAYKNLLARGAPGDWTTIPADIVQVTDEQSALHCLLENIEREDLSAAEEGAAYAGLIQKYELANAKELAAKLGIDEQRVARRLRINEGPDCIKQALTRGLKVPLPEAEDGSRKKNETRRLSFHGALDFLKVYEHHRRKNPGTHGGRPDGRPVADIKTEPIVTRALSEGWSRQRIQVEVQRILKGKPPTVGEEEPSPAQPLYEQRQDRFVVFTQRALKGTAAEREAIVAELRKALAALPAPV